MKRFNRSLVLVLVAATAGVFAVACVRKRADETPSDASMRKRAVYTAQSASALQGWSDMVLVLEKGSVISGPAAKASYAANEKVLSALDIVRQRLKDGYPAKDAITIIETSLTDLDAAESAGLLAIASPDGKAKYRQVVFSVRFGLNSIKAVLAASKEPSTAEARAVARRALSPAQDAPLWWTDAVLVVQNTITKWFEQSRMDTSEAWNDGAAVSVALHKLNAERLK